MGRDARLNPNADEFRGERLPDLPNVGYQSQRQREVSDQIQEFIRQIERDRLRLLLIVLHGRDRWRAVAGSVLGNTRIDTDALDAMFDYLVLMSASGELREELLANLKNPPKFRECLLKLQRGLEVEIAALRGMAKREAIPEWDQRGSTRRDIAKQTASEIADALTEESKPVKTYVN